MEKELVERLTVFGLSVNQAKVYLSIVQGPSTNVNTIAKSTGIHRQDIYKILPKLEERGLITQTKERPTTIQSIAVEQALNQIVNIEQQKTNDRIKRLKAGVKALANAIEDSKTAGEMTTVKKDVNVIFLSTDRAIKNSLDESYKNVKAQCTLVLNFELLMRRAPSLRKRYQILATNNVKTRLLIDSNKNQDLMKRTLEEILPKTGDFTVKFTSGKITVKPYLIFDCKEIYIFTNRRTPLFLQTILWTNSENVIHIYQDNFDRVWKSSSASISFQPTRQYHKPHPTASKASFV